MSGRKLLLSAVLGLIAYVLTGQVDHWTTIRVGDFECEFPSAYTRINFTGASGVHYEGGNLYMTVTSLPDTSSMKGNLDRDYTRDFMEIVHSASQRLNGRVREYRDTVIGNMPGYISRQEVIFNNGKRSYYDLVQLLHQDSMRGFSAQYYRDDPKSAEAARKFFQSIRFAPQKSTPKGQGKYGIWIGGGLIVVLGIWAWIRFTRH